MGNRTRSLLKKQLLQTAEQFEKMEEGELLVSSIDAAAALMRYAVTDCQKELDEAQYQNAFGGVVRTQMQIAAFCAAGQQNLDASLKQYVEEQEAETEMYLDRKAEFEQEKVRLHADLKTAKLECEQEEVKKEEAKQEYEQIRKTTKFYRQEQEAYVKRKQEEESALESLQKERVEMEETVQHIHEALVGLQETQEDLKAFRQELDRIQKGLAEDGYVDMESVEKVLSEKKEAGEQLIADYDRIIKGIFTEVESLKQKVAKRNQTEKQE